jgi:hypothetical protein
MNPMLKKVAITAAVVVATLAVIHFLAPASVKNQLGVA